MSWTKPMGSLRVLLLVLFMVPLTVITTHSPAMASRRVALIIGNSAYRSVPRLDNPLNDAKLMARTLRSLGFDLVGGDAQVDLDKAHFDAALQSFGDQVQGADVSLFYYAGHGVQVAGKNFLAPIEANPTKEADVYLQMIDTNIVLSQMEGSGSRLNIVLLDACRNSPFAGRGLRALAGGLAQMQAPEGTLISYATQPGNVAFDGANGDSPYTAALAATITRPGLGLFDAFNEVGLAVKRATGGVQQPWVSSSPIEGGFYFAGPEPTVVAAASPPPDSARPNVVTRATDQAPPAAATGGLSPSSAAKPQRPESPPTAVATLSLSAALDQPAPAKPRTDAPSASAAVAAIARPAVLDQPATAKPSNIDAPIAACDRLAAAPLDPDRPRGVAGVDRSDIDSAAATQACRAALALQPDNPRLMFELGRALAKDGVGEETLALYRKAAAAGHAGAMNNLGAIYEGGRGVTRDIAQAMRWYRRSADAGDGSAMRRLGLIYERGDGVPRDPFEALTWFRKAADAGNVLGMSDVGRAYASGFGVARNPAEAMRWFRKAAEAGGPFAMDRLGFAYLRGFGVERDPAEAVRWFRKAAEAGNPVGMENLGNAYKDGVGVARDEAEAARWLQKAKQ